MGILNTKLHPVIGPFVIVVAFIAAIGTGCLSSNHAADSVPLNFEENMEETWNTTVAVIPPIDAKQPVQFETATFAVG